MTTATAPAMPEALARRPRDPRGLPYTWASGDGPDLLQGVNVAARCARAILERLCGACGEPLGYWVAFIGDEASVARRAFIEPPLHPDCARYAVAVCPYLASPRYVGKRRLEGVTRLVDPTRPARMALYLTRSFEPLYGDHPPMAHAGAPKTVEWF